MKHNGSATYQRFPMLDGLTALQAEQYQNSFAPHSHETFQITLNESGLFKNQINGHCLCAWPDALIITHPDEIHTTICDQPMGHSFFTLYVSPDLFSHRNNGIAPRFAHVLHNTGASSLLQEIKHHSQTGRSISAHQIIKLLDQLLTEQLHEPVRVADHSWLTDHLQETIDQPFKLAETARQTGISSFKLIRLCKAETGMTPLQFVINQRILSSQQLLRQGVPITDVALQCGFYDAAHFHRHFKKLTGLTPASFRKPWLS
ncbi:helix-turn-helix domain-containing protein [Marinicella sediminis]|uniref:Helix-turn-helix domain-containing protein n=1 Tax=Marinicella sediminis TaxID=1792834 RepID=A0ABV7JHU8_9GAMM|nr:AraC family transcriptional regulator [Marinicella sediminis]